MNPSKLQWDSEFFGCNVYSVSTDSIDEFVSSLKELKERNAELVYIFTPHMSSELDEVVTAMGGVLFDQKVVYKKTGLNGRLSGPGSVKEYKEGKTEQLYNLALSAGHESRFRKDPRLSGRFAELYRIWLENSLAGRIADRVFVSEDNDGINGFATCAIKDDCGVIGLIATEKGSQGKGIGKALVEAVESYYRDRSIQKSSVVTQLSNKQACAFYEKCGFEIDVIENVYHLWL